MAHIPILHELLPAEASLEQQADKTRKELIQTFEKKRNHFEKRLVTYQPKGEGEPPTTEEQLAIQTTVTKELAWWGTYLMKALDASLRVAEANTRAKADIILEGTVDPLAQGIPATALLELEKRVTEVRGLVEHIPTLDPSKGFEPDATEGDGIFRAREITKDRTKKTPKAFELAPATKEHAAQVQLIQEDVVVGTIKEQVWSGLITPAAKADMLDRCDRMLRAVKEARARANQIDIDVRQKIGEQITNYIFG